MKKITELRADETAMVTGGSINAPQTKVINGVLYENVNGFWRVAMGVNYGA